jgi:predicted RNase H-like nuclease (RuvC/YqgF family)
MSDFTPPDPQGPITLWILTIGGTLATLVGVLRKVVLRYSKDKVDLAEIASSKVEHDAHRALITNLHEELLRMSENNKLLMREIHELREEVSHLREQINRLKQTPRNIT